MKKYKSAVLLMAVVILFITGCEEESTAPDPYSNGIMITLATGDGSKEYNARNNVSCSKDGDYITFFAEDSDKDAWMIKFLWDNTAQNGDIVYIYNGATNYNEISLTTPNSPLIEDYQINRLNVKANETFIKVIEFVDGEKIEAEVEGFIYEIGGSGTPDSLKNGYFITTNFVAAKK